MSFKQQHRETERKRVTQEVLSTSNGSQHSYACVISSFLFAIVGFVAISRRKLLKLTKKSIILIRQSYEIVIQAGSKAT